MPEIKLYEISYNPWKQLIIVDGMKFSGQIFSHFKDNAQKGRLFRFEKQEEGEVYIKSFDMSEISNAIKTLELLPSSCPEDIPHKDYSIKVLKELLCQSSM